MALFLTACGERRQPPIVRSPLADSADQLMFAPRFNLTDKGVIRAQLDADTGYFFDDNTRVEFDDVRTTFYTSTGVKDATLTARHGEYSTRLGDMTATGNVVVTTEAGKRLVTPELHYSQGRNEFSSDSQFVLTEPGRQLAGIGFRSDPNLNNVRVLRGASGFATGGVIPETQRPAIPPGVRDTAISPAAPRIRTPTRR